jgi:3-hydroxybutyryl-CoA dehydrogenase
MRTPRRSPKAVYLAGEIELVREFGALCSAAGIPVICAHPPRGTGAPPREFRVSATVPRSVVAAVELTNTDIARKKRNLVSIDAALPPDVPVLSSAVTVTVGEQASWIQRPRRLVGLGAFPTLLGGPLLEVTASLRTDEASIGAAGRFLAGLGKEVSVVQDRVGLVMPRILCMVINEACFALTEQIAAPADIDTAMKLGTNYPKGPLEWANMIGIRHVISVLSALRTATGEERYRVAPLLYQMSFESGVWNK